jgi:uncharacterized membrane protein
MSTGSLQPMLHEPRLPGSAPPPPAPVRPSADARNVGEEERLVSLLAGGVCLGIGAAKRGWIGLGFAAAGASFIYRAVSGHCYTYQMLGIDRATHESGVRAKHGVRVSKSLHIARRPEDVAAFWEELPALPKIMRHLESVEQLEGNRSHWVAKVFGLKFEWDAETTAFTPGREIRFRSLPGGDIDTEGAVLFEPTEMGSTLLRVEMRYEPPGGAAADTFAHWIGGDLESQIDEDLNRFKTTLEATRQG